MNSTEGSTDFTTMQHWPETVVDTCVYAINSLFAFPVHVYVIWLIVTGTGSGVVLEFFNINLSICELCFSFNGLLGVLSKFVNVRTLLTFLIGVVITGRPLFQCLICVERYLAVVHPVTFMKYKPLRYRVICSTVVWVITLNSCVCSMLTYLLRSVLWFMWIFPIQFLLFLIIQLFCCVAVLRALKQSGPGERVREKREGNQMKRRAFYLIVIITVSTFIVCVPCIIIGVFTILTEDNIEACKTFSLVCFVLGGFVQPVLFFHRTGKLPCVRSS